MLVDNIGDVYGLCVDIPKRLLKHNKYTYLASKNIVKAKFLGINEVISKNTKVQNFITKYPNCLVFPNFFMDFLCDLTIRPLDSSEAILTLNNVKLPYNIGNIAKRLKYGDPLILVEGIADLGALNYIDPSLNVIAIRTNSIPKSMYEYYAMLTNKIIFLPDNDEAGKSQLNRIKSRFSALGVDMKVCEQFGDFKDTGDFIDLVMQYQISKDISLLDDIKCASEYYKNIIKVSYE